jgi:hypothetical protein
VPRPTATAKRQLSAIQKVGGALIVLIALGAVAGGGKDSTPTAEAVPPVATLAAFAPASTPTRTSRTGNASQITKAPAAPAATTTNSRPKAAAKPKATSKPKVNARPKVKSKPNAVTKPKATSKPKVNSKPKVTAKPKPKATAKRRAFGINGNPWGYDFKRGRTISSAPGDFCSYFDCIASFWDSTNGWVALCRDGMYSHSGGRRGACSHHGGVDRPLYRH